MMKKSKSKKRQERRNAIRVHRLERTHYLQGERRVLMDDKWLFHDASLWALLGAPPIRDQTSGDEGTLKQCGAVMRWEEGGKGRMKRSGTMGTVVRGVKRVGGDKVGRLILRRASKKIRRLTSLETEARKRGKTLSASPPLTRTFIQRILQEDNPHCGPERNFEGKRVFLFFHPTFFLSFYIYFFFFHIFFSSQLLLFSFDDLWLICTLTVLVLVFLVRNIYIHTCFTSTPMNNYHLFYKVRH